MQELKDLENRILRELKEVNFLQEKLIISSNSARINDDVKIDKSIQGSTSTYKNSHLSKKSNSQESPFKSRSYINYNDYTLDNSNTNDITQDMIVQERKKSLAFSPSLYILKRGSWYEKFHERKQHFRENNERMKEIQRQEVSKVLPNRRLVSKKREEKRKLRLMSSNSKKSKENSFGSNIIRRDLETNKKKRVIEDRIKDQCTFSPVISNNSRLLAQHRGSSYSRLFCLENKQSRKKLPESSEQQQLRQCTFTPRINKKSIELTQRSSSKMNNSSRLLSYVDKIQQNKDKLIRSKEIKSELEFKKECTFHPKVLKSSSIGMVQRGNFIERMEDWNRKKELKVSELAKQIEGDSAYPFKPNTCQYSKKKLAFPKEIANDRYLLEGMANYLEKQKRAKKKKDNELEIKDIFKKLRSFI